MNYIIRDIEKYEYPLLADFLYEAIYIPNGVEPPEKAIIACPELQLYIKEFGELIDDKGFAAEIDGHIVGAVWVRIMNDYGHVDDNTPSLAISLYSDYRGLGIGSDMLNTMISYLKRSGYPCVSLAVQKDNYAVEMYKRAGFEIVGENSEEYIMVNRL